jgi:hypothetical protein
VFQMLLGGQLIAAGMVCQAARGRGSDSASVVASV